LERPRLHTNGQGDNSYRSGTTRQPDDYARGQTYGCPYRKDPPWLLSA